jgi:hypothetical protein
VRRAIVHIGTPRTGTTSVQANLAAHRKALREVGILYPELTPRSTSIAHLSHQHLGETLDGRRSRRERTELLSRLDEALIPTDIDVVILSYEGLCITPSFYGVPTILAELFGRRGFDLEVLLTVRSQASYAQSQYLWRCQFLREKQFFAEAFSCDLRQRQRRYDYNAIFDDWARAKPSRFHVVPVHDRTSTAPLVERIFAQLELTDRLEQSLTAAEFARVENRSPGPASVEVSRRVRNRSLLSIDQARAIAVTDFIGREALVHGLDSEPFQGLDDATVTWVEAKFADSNEQLAQRVWGMGWSQRIAPMVLGPVNEFGARPPERPVIQCLEEITNAACQKFGISGGATFNSVKQVLSMLDRRGRTTRKVPRQS